MNKLKKYITSIGFLVIGKRIRDTSYLDPIFQTSRVKEWLAASTITDENYVYYLSRISMYSIFIGIISVIIGLFTGILLTPFLQDISLNITVRGDLAIKISKIIKNNLIYIFPPLFSVIFGSLITIISFISFYLFLSNHVGNRKRKIDKNLVHVAPLLYAGSTGSSNMVRAFRKVADSKEMYGETAVEFEKIMGYIDNGNYDVITAINKVKNETPSDKLSEFLENLESTIKTGADASKYFEDKTKEYHQRQKTKQNNFIDLIQNIQNILFISVIILFLISLGGSGLFLYGSNQGIILLAVVSYFFIPMVSIVFTWIIWIKIKGQRFDTKTLRQQNTQNYKNTSILKAFASKGDFTKKEIYDSYIMLSRKKYNIKKNVKNLLRILVLNPLYSLYFSVPISTLLIAILTTTDLVSVSKNGFMQAPIIQTVVFIGIPLIICGGIVSLLHEYNQWRKKSLEDQFKDMLQKAEENNKRGLTLIESIRLISQDENTILANELEKMYNRLSWSGELNNEFISFANRLENSKISRSVNLLIIANEISGEINNVIKISRKDIENMIELDRKQSSKLSITVYLFIVIFIFQVGSTLIVENLILTTFYEQLTQTQGIERFIGGFGQIETLNPIKLLLFHQSITYGIFIGPVLGMLRSNSFLSGLKYSILFFTITTISFGVF